MGDTLSKLHKILQKHIYIKCMWNSTKNEICCFYILFNACVSFKCELISKTRRVTHIHITFTAQ